MPKTKYIEKKFAPATLVLIETANEIIAEYTAQGFMLTTRQLYYQFVARDIVENTTRSYKRLASIISDGRLAGLIDWNAIEDRTRAVKSVSHWETPGDIIGVCATSFRIDKWQGQEYRPEVWIEKEALAGVIAGVCTELDIPFLSCRGYTSQSEMWSSAMRLRRFWDDDQRPIILHFGDHDPSGIDMTRDIKERMKMFGAASRLTRLALNRDQVDKYNPPPNPAKVTDSRFGAYVVEHGVSSWELDALEPSVLADLVRKAVLEYRDEAKWDKAVQLENQHRARLQELSEDWEE